MLPNWSTLVNPPSVKINLKNEFKNGQIDKIFKFKHIINMLT